MYPGTALRGWSVVLHTHHFPCITNIVHTTPPDQLHGYETIKLTKVNHFLIVSESFTYCVRLARYYQLVLLSYTDLGDVPVVTNLGHWLSRNGTPAANDGNLGDGCTLSVPKERIQ